MTRTILTFAALTPALLAIALHADSAPAHGLAGAPPLRSENPSGSGGETLLASLTLAAKEVPAASSAPAPASGKEGSDATPAPASGKEGSGATQAPAPAKEGTSATQAPAPEADGSGPASSTPPSDGSASHVLGGSPPADVQREIDRNHAADEKIAKLQDAATAHPNEVRYQVDLVEGMLDAGRVGDAMEIAPDLVQRFPRSAELLVAFGRTLMRDGKFDLAEVQFQRAIAIQPSLARAHTLLARDSFIRGDLKAAETEFRKALTLDPSQADIRESLAQILERTGRYADALSILKPPSSREGESAAAELTGRRSLLAEFVKAAPFAIPETFTSVTVPFVTARGFPPFVQIKIGETFDKYFVVDTASDDVNVTQAAARALGLPEKGKSTVKDAQGREHVTAAYALLDAVKIGEVTIKRVPVRVSPGLKYPDERIAGTLGRDFLRRFRVTLDYPARTVTLARADGPPLEGSPFDLASVILLDGFNGDRAVGKFVMDTASYTPGALDARFVATETGLTIFSQDVKPIKDGGPYLFKFTMPSLKVGGTEFSKFPATAVDLRMMSRQIGVDVRGVIGVSLLRQCRVQIDFKNQRLSFQKTGPAVPAAEPGA